MPAFKALKKLLNQKKCERFFSLVISFFQNQVIEDLNKKNSLLNSEKDELNKLILEHSQQLSGADPSPQSLTEKSFCSE